MVTSTMIMTWVAVLLIWNGVQQLRMSRNVCLFNLCIVGQILSFTMLIDYMHFQILSSFISKHIPIIRVASISSGFFLFVFLSIQFRLNYLSERHNFFLLKYEHGEAAKYAETRLKFVKRYYGNHFTTGTVLTATVSFYSDLGISWRAEVLFNEALKVFQKSSFLTSRTRAGRASEANVKLKLSNFYLLEGNFPEAERQSIDVIKNSRREHVGDMLITQALQISALISGAKGDHRKFVTDSASAKHAYQSWLDKQRRFQKLQDRMKRFGEVFISNSILFTLFLIFIPPILFPAFRTNGYAIFVVIYSSFSQLGDWFLRKLARRNLDQQESIIQYCSLLEQEGDLYRNLGDSERALEKYDEVLNKLYSLYINSTSKELIIAKNHLNKATILNSIEAIQLLSKNLSNDYEGFQEQALSSYNQAIKTYEEVNTQKKALIPIKSRIEHAVCLMDRSLVYARKVGIIVAQAEVAQDFERAKDLIGFHSKNYASKLIDLGSLYYSNGMYLRAKDFYAQAEEVLSKELRAALREKIKLHISMSFLNAAEGEVKNALERVKKSNELADRMFFQSISVVAEQHRLYVIKNNRLHTNVYATLVYKHFLESSVEVGLLVDFILQRKAVGLEVSAIQKSVISAASFASDETKQKLKVLEATRRELAHKTISEDNSMRESDIDSLYNARLSMEEELARSLPELDIENKMRVVNRDSVSHALPQNSVLVEIIIVDFIQFNRREGQNTHTKLKEPHYLACIIHSKQHEQDDSPGGTRLIDLGKVQAIDLLIENFRNAVTGEVSTNKRSLGKRDISIPELSQQYVTTVEEYTAGTQLRKQIFDPLARTFGNAVRIFFSPDGNLTQVPIEILPISNMKRLIDLYSISYLSSGRDILRTSASSSQRKGKSVVIADPNFDCAEGSHNQDSDENLNYLRSGRSLNLDSINLKRLEGTRQEGEIVAAILQSDLWTGDAALKERMFSHMQSPKVLHIATHGLFVANRSRAEERVNRKRNSAESLQHRENPLLNSCIALAGANCKSKGFIPRKDAGNGILTAEEACSLDLNGTDLVVLSACDTGRGDTLVGEGVFGLRRAFVISGADTLVMSLWKVPDKQTKELMISFYNQLLSGTDRVEALRNAQLEVRKNNPHPYFWGAFVCQGMSGKI